MAHFAKLDENNIVQQVVVVHNNIATGEQAGVDFLNNLYKTSDAWKQTSYNTHGGVHQLGGTPFRKNYAGIGFTYDASNDAFIAPQPYNSWTLDETTYQWIPPIVKPDAGSNGTRVYTWNEEAYQADNTQGWDLIPQ